MPLRTLLFHEDIGPYLNRVTENIKYEIRNLPHERVNGCTDEKFIEYFEGTFSLPCPEIYFESLGGVPLDSTITNPDIRIEIAYRDPQNFLRYRTLNANPAVLEFEVLDGLIKFVIPGGTPENMKTEKNRVVSIMRDNLEKLTKTINAFNGAIPTVVRTTLVERRKTAIQHDSFLEKLDIPLKKKDNPLVELPPLRQKLTPKLPEPNSPEEPKLQEDTYKHILKICGDMARAMELSPSVFTLLKKEEQLRALFLVLLNGNYEGGMTAETFNFGGKTDICYRYKGRNLFVAECKIWDGVTVHEAAIEQLRGYLSWRDSKTALIVFVKKKDFTGILEKMFTATKEHEGCRGELESNRMPNSRRYTFTNKIDEKQTFAMTVLAFHLPDETTAPEESPT
jgi:hypothetical protein